MITDLVLDVLRKTGWLTFVSCSLNAWAATLETVQIILLDAQAALEEPHG